MLTDGPHFQGSAEHCIAARAAVALPVLRKDFMLDPWQVYESRAMGADCILLIMAALDRRRGARAGSVARIDSTWTCWSRCTTERELDARCGLQTPLIGINNRNLKTLQTDLATTEQLAPLVPPDRFLVAESGIRDTADLQRLAAVGLQLLPGRREPDAPGRTSARRRAPARRRPKPASRP